MAAASRTLREQDSKPSTSEEIIVQIVVGVSIAFFLVLVLYLAYLAWKGAQKASKNKVSPDEHEAKHQDGQHEYVKVYSNRVSPQASDHSPSADGIVYESASHSSLRHSCNQCILISLQGSHPEQLLGQLNRRTAAIVYDCDAAGPTSLLAAVRRCAPASRKGGKLQSICFICPTAPTNSGAVLTAWGRDSCTGAAAAFWEELGSMVDKAGRVHLLACNSLCKQAAATDLLWKLHTLTGATVSASDDLAGNQPFQVVIKTAEGMSLSPCSSALPLSTYFSPASALGGSVTVATQADTRMNPFKSTLRYLDATGQDIEAACWVHMEDDEAKLSASAVVDMVRESQAVVAHKDALHVTAFLIPAAAGGSLDSTLLKGTFKGAAAMHEAALELLHPSRPGDAQPSQPVSALMKSTILSAGKNCQEYVQRSGVEGLRKFLARASTASHCNVVPKTDAPRLCRALLQLLGFSAKDTQAVLVLVYEAFPTLDQNGSIPLLRLLDAFENGFQFA